MRENALYDRLRPKFKEWGAVSRVENAVETGTPDVFLMIAGQYNWVETKVDHQGEIYYERFQLSWHRRYLREGGTNLFTMTAVEGSRSGLMRVYHMSEVTEAPFTTKGKWFVIKAEGLTPILEMSKTYDWDKLRLLLSSPFTLKT